MKPRKQYIYRLNYKGEILEGTIEDLMAYTGKKYNAIHSYLSYPNSQGAMLVCGSKIPVYKAFHKTTGTEIAEGTIDEIAKEYGVSVYVVYWRYALEFDGKYEYEITSAEIPELVRPKKKATRGEGVETIDDVVAQIGRMKYLNRVNKDVYQPSPTMLKRLKEAGIKLKDIEEIKVEEGAEV